MKSCFDDELAATNRTASEGDDEQDLTMETEAMESSTLTPQDTGCVTDNDPMTLEVEMKGPARRFVHQITASYPFQVIVAGHPRWLGRKSKIAIVLVCLVLFILTIALPISRRKTSRAQEQLRRPAKDTKDSEDDPGLKPEIKVVAGGDDVFGGEEGAIVEGRTPVSFSPFSLADPADYFPVTDRAEGSIPSSRLAALQEQHSSLPTNAWYQNFLLLRDGESPTADHRAYTQPYVVDVAGPLPGLRMQLGSIDTTSDQVIVADGTADALTFGVASPSATTFDSVDMGYNVVAANDLGLTLEWVSRTVRLRQVISRV
jgi:hypothetical protein